MLDLSYSPSRIYLVVIDHEVLQLYLLGKLCPVPWLAGSDVLGNECDNCCAETVKGKLFGRGRQPKNDQLKVPNLANDITR